MAMNDRLGLWKNTEVERHLPIGTLGIAPRALMSRHKASPALSRRTSPSWLQSMMDTHQGTSFFEKRSNDTDHISSPIPDYAKVDLSKLVISDWERLRQIDDYETTGGKILFMHLFEKCPEAKPLFGFAMSVNPRSANLLKSNRFSRHAKFLLKMLDKTVDMLGAETTSDDEHGRGKRLTDVLTELGRKHVAYGVKPAFFPFMTESVLAMLGDTIGNPNADAWNSVFSFLIAQMTSGYDRIQKGVAAAADKGRCMAVWDKLSKIPRYKKEGGIVLFQHLFVNLPETKVLFGFPADVDPHSDDLLKSIRFGVHAEFLIEMIEKTINLLGEDDETLEEVLCSLGQRHVAFGVAPEHFPHMTKALIHMLKEMMSDDFSKEDEKSFEHVMALLIADMVKGQRKVDKDLSANKKEIVTASWAQLAATPDYQHKAGMLLFQNLFELCPDTKLLFGFPKSVDPQSGALLKNERFIKHATFLLTMIEKAVGMLGQDDADLTETLLELGRKHVTYGVRPEYFPFMTTAIIKMMKEILGGEFTADDEAAWVDILSLFITDIVRGERMLDMGLAATHKKVTDTNWAKLKEIDDYDEVAGLAVFRNLFKVCPEAKPLFGLNIDMPDSEVAMSKRVLVHATFIIEMVEKALTMLGKNDAELQTFMEELGRKHIVYQVTPEHMPHMSASIVHMLNEVLGQMGAFSPEEEEAWKKVLAALVANMTKAQREVEMKKIAEEMTF